MEGDGSNMPVDLPPLMLAAYGGCYTCRHAQVTPNIFGFDYKAAN